MLYSYAILVQSCIALSNGKQDDVEYRLINAETTGKYRTKFNYKLYLLTIGKQLKI